MQTIHFEDCGQDFLEWDVDQDGVVLDSRPFQAEVWRGWKGWKGLDSFKVGELPMIVAPGTDGPRMLDYRVVRVAGINPFVNEDGYGAVAAADRIHVVSCLGLRQCYAALDVPGLQKTVEQRLRARIRKLEKEAAHG